VEVCDAVLGPTPAQDDDVVLEAKQLRDLSSVPYVQASALGGRLRTILGHARLGGNDDPLLAVIPRGPEGTPDGPPSWVQSWQPDYRELRRVVTNLRHSRFEFTERE
jgi:hypothetical protein